MVRIGKSSRPKQSGLANMVIFTDMMAITYGIYGIVFQLMDIMGYMQFRKLWKFSQIYGIYGNYMQLQ